MSDSLLTRYRPRNFDEVLGQDEVVASLRSAVLAKRGRAFLFTGPSGVGKTTLARITADALGCTDLVPVDAATNTGVDDMRAVADTLLYKPLGQDGMKGIIVDECHMLSKAAWNSMLKAIEEPPPWGCWLLCTTEPAKVPDTIKTRCLSYSLSPLGRGDLIGLLQVVAEEEKLDFGEAHGPIIQLCANEAQGSPRQALANLGACAGAKTRAEAATLLRSAAENATAVELARALVRGAGWSEVWDLINSLGEVSPESVRHIVQAYLCKVVLGAKNEDAAGKALEMLDAFSEPFPPHDGMAPLLLACGRIVLG